MPDTIVAKGSDAKFLSHPEGQFVGSCVDTIDLGENVETFAGQPSKLAHKCALVFRTGERNPSTHDYIDIGREFTVSMSEKANLRKFLEQWRGKPYTSAQIEEGVPLQKLVNQPGLISVAHKTSGTGRTYAIISSCVGVPKQMQGGVGTYPDYKRDDYWNEKKKQYAEAARKFRNESSPPSDGDDFDDFPQDTGGDDDSSGLPF